MKDVLETYIARVRDLSEHCQGNEQATKQSLIGPLFTMLGYDLTDPRECRPEYRADFGKDRSVKPVDWAFLKDGRPVFLVEAKEVGRRLGGYDEQLADYFAKAPEAKLGILTNGQNWRFFTDIVNANVMDHEPFVKWDVLTETPPYDFLILLQKAKYNPELIRTFAMRLRNQNLLVGELSKLLEPSSEFTKLAIVNLETRTLMPAVVESWKPVVAGALNEWVRQRMLTSVLSGQHRSEEPEAPLPVMPKPAKAAALVETTPEELEAFAIIRRLLGVDRAIAYQDTASNFKVHLPEKNSWVVCRLCLGRKKPMILLPMPQEQVVPLAGGRVVTIPELGWSSIAVTSVQDLEDMGELLRTVWDLKRRERPVAGMPPPKVEVTLPLEKPIA